MWHADEIEWMWDLFPGKYAKCRVFALLYGLTKNGNGWRGSNVKLGKVTRITPEGVRKILDELAAEQLIAQNGEHIRTTYEPDNSVADNSVAPSANSVATDTNPVATTDNSVASLPPTPPNTIKQMEQEITFAPTANSDVPQAAIPSFEAFLSAFVKRGGSYTEWQKSCAERIWSLMNDIEKKKAIIAELAKPDGFWKPRPDWYLQDFVMPTLPPPKDYNRTSEFLTKIKEVPLVSAKYNNSNGIFTLDDALKHHLDVNYGMNFEWDIYQQSGKIVPKNVD